MNKITAVLIDSREDTWVQRLTFGDAPSVVTLLETGDVWVSTSDDVMLLIEHKSPDDLLNSIKDGRLFNQCAEMCERSKWCYVIITGQLQPGANGKVFADGRETGWSWEAVQGALLTVQELGVGVVFARSDADFAATIERLAKRERGRLNISPRRTPHILSAGEAILAALPGIGFDKLNAVLEHAGTPAWALVYLTDLAANGDVPGIGNGTKRAVRKALGLPDDMVLSVLVQEQEKKEE